MIPGSCSFIVLYYFLNVHICFISCVRVVVVMKMVMLSINLSMMMSLLRGRWPCVDIDAWRRLKSYPASRRRESWDPVRDQIASAKVLVDLAKSKLHYKTAFVGKRNGMQRQRHWCDIFDCMGRRRRHKQTPYGQVASALH
jgi:hypothetical protein